MVGYLLSGLSRCIHLQQSTSKRDTSAEILDFKAEDHGALKRPKRVIRLECAMSKVDGKLSGSLRRELNRQFLSRDLHSQASDVFQKTFNNWRIPSQHIQNNKEA
jgi:hypothetical protein